MTTHFRLVLTCENDAFQPNPQPEVVRILREAADRLEQGYTGYGQLRDINGNTVGSYLIRTE